MPCAILPTQGRDRIEARFTGAIDGINFDLVADQEFDHPHENCIPATIQSDYVCPRIAALKLGCLRNDHLLASLLIPNR